MVIMNNESEVSIRLIQVSMVIMNNERAVSIRLIQISNIKAALAQRLMCTGYFIMLI